MYIAKIPGTKYITSLESKGGQWYLKLKLDDVTEAEEEIDQISKRSIRAHLNDLFDQVSLNINSFQIDLIHKELLSQISHLLLQDQHNQKHETTTKNDDSPKYDPRVDKLFEVIDKLESQVQVLSDRVERMEALTE